MNTIEIELRGYIPENASDLISQLKNHYDLHHETDELVIFFKYNHDFRFKIINKKAEYVLKKKVDSSGNQIEIITHLNLSDCASFLKQLSHMGYEQGLLSISKRKIFSNESSEFCLKYGTPIGDFFEIEKIVTDPELVEFEQKNLDKLLSKMGLRAWTDSQYKEQRKLSLNSMNLEPILVDGEINPKINVFLKSQEA